MNEELTNFIREIMRAIINGDIDHDCIGNDPDGVCMCCYKAQQVIDQLNINEKIKK